LAETALTDIVEAPNKTNGRSILQGLCTFCCQCPSAVEG
jgi:hypothetical protein